MLKFLAKYKVAITTLGIFGVVLLIRAIFVESIYPASTGDTANHLAVIDAMRAGQWGTWAYLGEVIVGLPVLGISLLFGVDTSSVFLVAEYLLLFGIGCVMYFVVRRLVNQRAAILTVLVAVLSTPSIFRLFSSGTIYSIVNMYLILPLVIYFLVRWFVEKRKRYLVGAIILTALFGVFHPNSLMFLFAMGLFAVGYVIYRWVKGYHREALVSLGVGLGVVGTLTLTTWATQPAFGRMFAEVGSGLTGSSSNLSPIGAWQFVSSFITLAPLAILCVAIIGLIQYRKKVKIEQETKLFLLMLASFVPFLAVGTFTNLAIDSWRHAIELSVILAVIGSCLAGILLTVKKSMVLIVIIMGLVGLGMIPTLSTFFELQGV